MKTTLSSYGVPLLLAAVLLAGGCGKKADAPVSVPPRQSAPMPALNQAAAATEPTATAPASATPLPPLPPELAPVEQGIKNFEAQYNRKPSSVFELLEKKCLKEMPKLPPGKTLYIDPATGRAQLNDGP